MKEIQLRKWHRSAGIIFAVFIFIQGLTGLILTIEDVLGVYWGGIVNDIHRFYKLPGHMYRLISGSGLLFMTITGVFIWYMTQKRMRKSQKK